MGLVHDAIGVRQIVIAIRNVGCIAVHVGVVFFGAHVKAIVLSQIGHGFFVCLSLSTRLVLVGR